MGLSSIFEDQETYCLAEWLKEPKTASEASSVVCQFSHPVFRMTPSSHSRWTECEINTSLCLQLITFRHQHTLEARHLGSRECLVFVELFLVQYTFSDHESIRLNQTNSSPSKTFFTIVASRFTGSIHRGGIKLLVNLLPN